MQKKQRLFYSVVVLLGLASFVSCFTAEFKRSKKEDVRWDVERNCYIPQSQAFGLGTAALFCLGLSQIFGNVFIYRNHRARHKTDQDGYKAADLTLPGVLLLLSWVSFVVEVLLLSTATSMSRTQGYGKGWLREECYLVKDGVFAASGCLVLLTLGAMIMAASKFGEKREVEQVKAAQEDTITKTQNQEAREGQDQTLSKKSETVIAIVEEANSIMDISRI